MSAKVYEMRPRVVRGAIHDPRRVVTRPGEEKRDYTRPPQPWTPTPPRAA